MTGHDSDDVNSGNDDEGLAVEEIRKRYPAERPETGDKDERLRWLESQMEMYELALCGIQDAVVVTDHLGLVTFANPAAERLFGLAEAVFRGQRVSDLIRDQDGRRMNGSLSRIIMRGEYLKDEAVFVQRSDDARISTLLSVSPLLKEGVLVRVIGIFRDQTELEKKNRELQVAKELAESLARTDEMTNLPNKRAFVESAEKYLALAQRHNESVAVVFIDPNGLKLINDTYGHEAGNLFIKEIARQLRATVYREENTVARYGGDEFVALLPRTTAAQARIVAQKLAEALSIELTVPTKSGMETLRLTAAIGIAVRSGKDIPSLEDVMSLADQAMYTSKRDKLPYCLDAPL